MMADKDIGAVIDALCGQVTDWLPCELPGRRAASTTSLMAVLGARNLKVAESFADAAAALSYATERANLDDRILVFGSFLTVAAALKFLDRSI
jgi:dihydrofolate synthase/folylpolyglutamate synthase